MGFIVTGLSAAVSRRSTFSALRPPAPPRNKTEKPTAQLECSTLTQIVARKRLPTRFDLRHLILANADKKQEDAEETETTELGTLLSLRPPVQQLHPAISGEIDRVIITPTH